MNPPIVFSPSRRTSLRRLGAVSVGLGAAGFARFAFAQAKPNVIRLGAAQPALGTPPTIAGSAFAIAHAKGWIDAAFAKDGIRIEWSFFKGAGPAVNEALSNGQLDFAFQGDLPSIVGRAAGLKTRLVAMTSVRDNIYLAVPAGSPVQHIEELRGKRVSIFKGTNLQLPINRVLEAHGLGERDVRAINFDTATAFAALSTKDIDAAFGALDLLRLRDQGAARILYTSKNQSPIFTRQSHMLVTEAFVTSRPELTQRVVSGIVQAARWASDDANRDEVFKLWSRAGTAYDHWKEEYAGEPLRLRVNPNFDPFIVGRYKDAVEQAYRFKLTRARFDAEAWIDPTFLQVALKQQKLERYWPVFQTDGQEARV